MVSAKKLQTVQEVKEQLGQYRVVGVLNMHKLPGKQLHEIRDKLRGRAVIRMVKKRLIVRIFEETGNHTLTASIQGEPALLLTGMSPFELARIIDASASKAAAKEGDRAPDDMVIKAGPTPLPPGPAIGELQRLKIPAGVEGNKIVVKKDTIVVKKGEPITKPVADLLGKLGIQPMEIRLDVVAAMEDGTVYTRDILFIPPEAYLARLQVAYHHAVNLSVQIGYYTKDTITIFLGKAHREAIGLAKAAGIVTKDTVGELLTKAHREMEAMKGKITLQPPGEETKEQKEEIDAGDNTKEKPE